MVLARTEDAKRVIEFLEGFGAELHTRTVTRTQEDRRVLERSGFQQASIR